MSCSPGLSEPGYRPGEDFTIPLFYSTKHTRDAVELRCLLMLLSTTYTGHILKLVIRNDFTISRLHIPGIQSRPFSCAHLLNSNTCVSQTVKLCWKYELYDAVIYVYNRGMGDFGTPLEVYWMLLSDKATFYDVKITENTFKTSWILARRRNGMVMAGRYNYALKLFLGTFANFKRCVGIQSPIPR
jgi:hypothetical protein